LRAGLHLLSAIAMGGILLAQHSMLPVWADIFAALLAALSLVTATVLLMAAWRPRHPNSR
jgi:hypothetical protein